MGSTIGCIRETKVPFSAMGARGWIICGGSSSRTLSTGPSTLRLSLLCLLNQHWVGPPHPVSLSPKGWAEVGQQEGHVLLAPTLHLLWWAGAYSVCLAQTLFCMNGSARVQGMGPTELCKSFRMSQQCINVTYKEQFCSKMAVPWACVYFVSPPAESLWSCRWVPVMSVLDGSQALSPAG